MTHVGLHHNGMHDFIMCELELGHRVALYDDSENNCGWSALDDIRYALYVRSCEEASGRDARLREPLAQ